MPRPMLSALLSLCSLIFSLAAATFIPHAALSPKDVSSPHGAVNGAPSPAGGGLRTNSLIRAGDKFIDDCIDLLSQNLDRTMIMKPQGKAEILEVCKLHSEVSTHPGWRLHGTSSRENLLSQNIFNGTLSNLCRRNKQVCVLTRKILECNISLLQMILNGKKLRMPKKSRFGQPLLSKAYKDHVGKLINSLRSSSFRKPTACQGLTLNAARLSRIFRRFPRTALKFLLRNFKKQLADIKKILPKL